jgi:hypothetical protein
MLLVGLPLVILVSSLVTLLIVKRFGREHFYFN